MRNHGPDIVAGQFGTLAKLFPGRIDLGLGRAPGTDQATLQALRRSPAAADSFPQDVLELQAFLAPRQPDQRIVAVPATGTEVPLWILGSSHFGAVLAAELGLPYAFASHFAPAQLLQALEIYRSRFTPSKQLDRPYAMVGANVKIGRAHVCTPVTNAHIVCRLLLDNKKYTDQGDLTTQAVLEHNLIGMNTRHNH